MLTTVQQDQDLASLAAVVRAEEALMAAWAGQHEADFEEWMKMATQVGRIRHWARLH